MNAALFSSKSVEWETPAALFDRLHAQYQFTLDVCATPENAKCKRFFTKEDNGLVQTWNPFDRVFCNPPYGRDIGHWVAKCAYFGRTGLAVMLLPARTDTRWWHDYVVPFGRVEFLRGRLKFNGHKNSAPFPSAVVVFGGAP